MKAKLIKTGKIIDVLPMPGYIGFYYNSNSPEVKYEAQDLEFDDLIDWEERRYEIAKDVLCSIKTHQDSGLYGGDKEEMSKYSVELANSLITILKQEYYGK